VSGDPQVHRLRRIGGLKKGYCHATHRTVPPCETLERYVNLLPAMGVTRIANVTGLDRIGMPVVMVYRPNARSLAVQQGKGILLEEAKVSGMMEAVERFHGEYPILPIKLNSYEQLYYTHNLVELELVPRVKGSLFDRSLELPWVEGFDLSNNESLWLPLELVAYRPTIPAPPGFGCFRSETTGLAAGNHLLEASVHALCEAIERDARTLWRFRPLEERVARRIDPASVDDPKFRALMEAIERAGVALAVWNVTGDIEVPTFTVRLAERDEASVLAVAVPEGGGAHPTKEIALLRALMEAVQSRVTMIVGAREDLDRRHYRQDNSRQPGGWRARILDGPAPADFGDVPTNSTTHFEEDLELLLGKLERAGIRRVIAVDLTREELSIPVVRIVVPELEDVDDPRRYVPGPRLRKLLMSERPSQGRRR
jgi:ribosomal protein S12 methylthiotransferase accessory factor